MHYVLAVHSFFTEVHFNSPCVAQSNSVTRINIFFSLSFFFFVSPVVPWFSYSWSLRLSNETCDAALPIPSMKVTIYFSVDESHNTDKEMLYNDYVPCLRRLVWRNKTLQPLNGSTSSGHFGAWVDTFGMSSMGGNVQTRRTVNLNFELVTRFLQEFKKQT